MEAEQARFLDARWSEMGAAGTQARHVSWYADTRSHLQAFLLPPGLSTASFALTPTPTKAVTFPPSRSTSFSCSTKGILCAPPVILAPLHLGRLFGLPTMVITFTQRPPPPACVNRCCSSPSPAPRAPRSVTPLLSASRASSVSLAQDQFLRKYESWKAFTSITDKSPEAFRKSTSFARDKSSAAAASTPSAPELWYARLAADQSIIPAAPARIDSV